MNNEFKFTKEHTQIAKGVAILLMLIHHLFGFPKWIEGVEYFSIFSIGGNDVELILGQFGKICVSMYLFLSGYGIYYIANKGDFNLKNRLSRIKKLYLNYWVVMIIFVILIPIVLKTMLGYDSAEYYNFEIKEFILNFLGLDFSYNKFAWFLKFYILIILFFPLLNSIFKGKSILVDIIKMFILFFGIDNVLRAIPYINMLLSQDCLSDISEFLFWQMHFVAGMLSLKYDMYVRVKSFCKKIHFDNIYTYIFLIFFIIMTRSKSGISLLQDILYAPIFIYLIVNIFYKSKLDKLFIFLGRHSTNMWLTHTFFVNGCFKNLVYVPKISILILIWLCILLLITSYLIDRILIMIKRCFM